MGSFLGACCITEENPKSQQGSCGGKSKSKPAQHILNSYQDGTKATSNARTATAKLSVASHIASQKQEGIKQGADIGESCLEIPMANHIKQIPQVQAGQDRKSGPGKNLQLDESSKLLSLEFYKNFTATQLTNQHNRLETGDTLLALAFNLFQLLSTNAQKLSMVTTQIDGPCEPIALRVCSLQVMQVNGSPTLPQCKLLFDYYIEYLAKKSSLELIQEHSILEAILQMFLITVLANRNQVQRAVVLQKYNKGQFDEWFIRLVATTFGLVVDYSPEEFSLKEGQRVLKIKKLAESKYQSWLEDA